MRRGTRAKLSALAGFLVVATGFPLGSPPGVEAQGSPDVVISEVYGGGGNSGATYTHDYIELFNRGTNAVDLTGWSVQYASATGSSWQVTALSGTLQPGQYYLVQQAAGAGGSESLPAPDVTGTTNMAATNGKVALVTTTTALTSSCPTGPPVRDFVGYGTADCFEGSAAAPGLNNTNAATRADEGCQDTDDNAADFSVAVAFRDDHPRNSASALNPCTNGDDPGDPDEPGDGVFALWDFEGATTDPAIDLTGNAAASAGSGLGNESFVAGNPSGTSDTSWSFNNWSQTSEPDATRYFEFKVDTSAYEDISLTFAERRSGTGPTTFVIHYSTDASMFTPIAATLTDELSGTDWRAHDFDFSTLNEHIAGQSAVQFRIYGYGASGSTGTWRIDDVTFIGSELDEPPQAGSPHIVISQVYGGGGNSGALYTHDFIELFNRGSEAQSLTGWSVQYASATGTSWQLTAVSGTLQPGQYYLIQQAQGAGGTAPLPTPDATGSIQMSATNGKVALVASTTALSGTCPTDGIIDFVGFGSTANCYEGSGPTATLNNTTSAIRLEDGCRDTDDNAADFSTASPPTPRNSASALNPCHASISTDPSGTGAADPSTVEAGDSTLLTVTVTPGANPSSTDLAVTGDLTAIGGSAAQAFVDDGTAGDEAVGDNVFSFLATVDVTTSAGPKALPITITDGQDRTANTVINLTVTVTEQCGYPFTPIYDIQGSGNVTPLLGQTVSTEGVVIGAYEGPSPALRGLYIQDPLGDDDPETSDGIFVFNANNVSGAAVGDLVRVNGRATEFQDQTQIDFVNTIVICDTGWEIEPTDVTLPFPQPVDGVDYLERYEGMLVRLPQTLYVTEHFQLGRFGQVTMSSGNRLFQPTNVVLPGPEANAMQEANDLNRIIIDDDLQNQNRDPIVFGRGGNQLTASNTLRGGDTATGIVGVMTYTWAGNAASGNAWRVRPESAMGGGVPDFQPANPRPTQAPQLDGTLRVSAFNLLNYFNTFSGCTGGVGGGSMDCRGADHAAEFERQNAKTIPAILGLDADVLGIIEIENDGYGPESAIAELVDRLNAAAGSGTYAFIDADAATGEVNAMGTDAIKVGFIYQPASVTPVGQTAVLNTVGFVNGGDPAPRNRPTLTQAFMENASGETFIASVHHLKSKGSACSQPDQGDGQANCNQVRVNAVNELLDWLGTDPTGTGDPDILIMGDLNSYAREDPIRALENAGYTNLIPFFHGSKTYSFAFDGQWGNLDHVMATQSLAAQVTGAVEWHINSDEPNVLDYNTNFKTPNHQGILFAADEFRSSDHDPVVVGLSLVQPSGRLTGSGTYAEGSFEINVQYRPDSAQPVGNSTFALAGQSFQSSAYDWLVVDADRATFQGTGLLDGQGGYAFFVSVLDGGNPGVDNDLIRLKVWELGGDVIYDSQPGDHISAMPTAPLTGGNLRVH
jgi:uncharacterized protein